MCNWKQQNDAERNFKDLSKWTDTSSSWIRRSLNIIKILILPKLMYRLNAIPRKIPSGFCIQIYKRILRFLWKSEEPRIAKTALKNNKAGDLTLQHIRLTKSYSNQDCQVLARINERKRIETLETDTYVYYQWINNEGAKKV